MFPMLNRSRLLRVTLCASIALHTAFLIAAHLAPAPVVPERLDVAAIERFVSVKPAPLVATAPTRGATLERVQRRFYLRYYFTPSVLWRYVRKRALYRATDPTEWQLAFGSLRYLLLERARQAQASRRAPVRPVADAPAPAPSRAVPRALRGGRSR